MFGAQGVGSYGSYGAPVEFYNSRVGLIPTQVERLLVLNIFNSCEGICKTKIKPRSVDLLI